MVSRLDSAEPAQTSAKESITSVKIEQIKSNVQIRIFRLIRIRIRMSAQSFSKCCGKGKGAYSSSWSSPQNYGTPLVNGITQCYLPPDRGDFTPTGQVGTWFIDPIRMKGWVGLVGWLHTEMVLTGSDVAQVRWSRPGQRVTTKPNRQPWIHYLVGISRVVTV